MARAQKDHTATLGMPPRCSRRLTNKRSICEYNVVHHLARKDGVHARAIGADNGTARIVRIASAAAHTIYSYAFRAE